MEKIGEELSKINPESINFKSIDQDLIYCSEDLKSISIITKKSNGENDYVKLKAINNSNKESEKEEELIDYTQLNDNQIQEELKKVLN